MQHRMVDVSLKGMVKTPTTSRHFKKATLQQQDEESSELLREEAIKAGLVPSPLWFGKVEQLHSLTQLKHGKNMFSV